MRYFRLIVLTSLIVSWGGGGCSSPQKDWEIARLGNTISDYEDFLRRHGNSRYADEARALLEERMIKRDWAATQLSDTVYAYEDFLKKYPGSQYFQEGLIYLKKLYGKRDWKRAESLNTISGYEEFLDQHPESRYTIPAYSKLMHLYASKDWRLASQINSLEEYVSFARHHPNSEFAAEAAKRIEQFSKDESVQTLKKRVEVESRSDPSKTFFPIFSVQKGGRDSFFAYKGLGGRYFSGMLDGSRRRINGIDLPKLRGTSPLEGAVLVISENDLRKDRIDQLLSNLSKEVGEALNLEKKEISFVFPSRVTNLSSKNGEPLEDFIRSIENGEESIHLPLPAQVDSTTKRDIVVEKLVEDLKIKLEDPDIEIRKNAATALLYIESKHYYSRSLCVQVEQTYGVKDTEGSLEGISLPIKPLATRILQKYTYFNLECPSDRASDIDLRIQMRGEAIGVKYINYELTQVVYKAASLSGTVHLEIPKIFESTKPYTGYVNNAPQHLLIPSESENPEAFHPPQDAPFEDALKESSIGQALLEAIGDLFGIESIEPALIDENERIRIGAAEAIKNLIKLGNR